MKCEYFWKKISDLKLVLLLCMLNCKSSQDFFSVPRKDEFFAFRLPYVFFSYVVRVQIDAISLLTDKPSKRETGRLYY